MAKKPMYMGREFQPLEKEPPKGKRAPWPPDGYRAFYRAGASTHKSTESWQSVAMGYLVPDVWDLIYFNFRTENKREVNWYLHYYVGCWNSKDGKNLTFEDADPGFIYIPPFGWKRSSPSLTLPARVAHTLSVVAHHYPYVSYGGVHVSRGDLMAVIEAIRTGLIAIKVDPGLNDEAHYEPTANELTLKSSYLTGLETRITLLHEATHAIIDMKKYLLPRWKNELIAYAVAALFTQSSDPSYAAYKMTREDVNGVEKAALELARHIDGDKTNFKRLEDYDKPLPSIHDPKSKVNPVRRLRNALGTLFAEHGLGSSELIESDGIWPERGDAAAN